MLNVGFTSPRTEYIHMSLNPKFQQYSFDYETEGEDSAILRRIVRNSWNAGTRESITSIQPAEDWEGNVYKISFEDNRNPPTIGGYVEGLVRHGWGFLYHDENSIYVARIIPHDEGYRFEGRGSVEPDIPPIRTVPDTVVDEEMPLDNSPSLRDERRIKTLREHIKSKWPIKTLESIEDVTYSTSEYNCYIINTSSNTEIEENEDGTCEVTHREVPDSPLGEHVDALLRGQWCVATIKSNSLFISRFKKIDEPSFTRNSYKFENSERLMYIPKKCEFCEDHEYYHMVVTDTRESEITGDELPIYTRSCLNCSDEKDHPTSEEYYDRESEKEA